eukprot:16295198-Heterocapsa_arctica.AAC.1
MAARHSLQAGATQSKTGQGLLWDTRHACRGGPTTSFPAKNLITSLRTVGKLSEDFLVLWKNIHIKQKND